MLHPQAAHRSGGLSGPAFTPYEPPLACNWWAMDGHTACGDVVPYVIGSKLFTKYNVRIRMKKYDEHKATQLWFRASDGTYKRVKWDNDKILEFTRSRRQAEGNPRFT
eukprot:COSAG05_NODE_54_length_23549_cov_81.790840_15_plen_108_part_00